MGRRGQHCHALAGSANNVYRALNPFSFYDIHLLLAAIRELQLWVDRSVSAITPQ